MKYQLKGNIILSKEITDEQNKVLEYLKQSEEDIKRTLKDIEEIDYKSESKFEDNKTILISISTIKHSSALLFYRIKKSLAGYLGKKLRVGIKSLTIKHMKIIFPIDRMPLDEITIPFVSKLNFNEKNKTCTIELENVDKKFITKNFIERIIKRIKEKIERAYYEGKGEFHELLYSSPEKEIIYNGDPTKEMQELDWIRPASTKGKWVYWAPAAAIFRAMEKIVVKELLEPFQFQEIINSNIVSGEKIWLRTGHLEGMPMEIYYVAEPITRDVKQWENFIDLLKITKEIPYDELMKMLQFKPLQGLTYAQCPSIYWAFKGKTIAAESFPILLYERKSNSFRYESGGRHGIERVDEFHRIEIVFIGKPEDLLKIREQLVEKYKYIFNEILDIEWRMAQVTPFYMQQAGKVFKEGLEEGNLGTIDFEAWLPYRGDRKETEWLEFQNLSIVGEKYIKAFTIKHQKKEKLWSGCTGIGLERWVVVFLAQHGFDVNKWPEKFKKYLGKIPEPIKFF